MFEWQNKGDSRIEDGYKRRIVVGHIIITATGFIYSAYYHHLGNRVSSFLFPIVILFSILTVISLFCYLKLKIKKIGEHFPILSAGVMCFSAALFLGGINMPSAVWVTALPAAAGILSGKKGIVSWGIISFVMIVILILLELFQLTPIHSLPLAHLFTIKIMALVIISSVIALFAFFIEKEITYLRTVVKSENRRLTAVLRMSSHDLISSSSIISGHIELFLDDDKETERCYEYKASLESIRASIQNMQSLLLKIREILILKKGQIDLEIVPMNITAIIFEMIEVFEDVAKNKNITIINNVCKKGCIALADPNYLGRYIIKNVIENAIKYSPINGTVYVSSDSCNDFITINIRDEGKGVHESVKEHMFSYTRFIPRLGSAGEIGLGLGLLFSSYFLDAMGGRIGFESDNGATFSITLPRAY